MALTYSKVARLAAGNYRKNVFDFTADATYTAGGYSLATADLEALIGPDATIGQIISFDSETNTAGVSLSLDRTNTKLKFYLGGTEATTTVSTASVRATLYHGASNYK
jgi:hypothetical protein